MRESRLNISYSLPIAILGLIHFLVGRVIRFITEAQHGLWKWIEDGTEKAMEYIIEVREGVQMNVAFQNVRGFQILYQSKILSHDNPAYKQRIIEGDMPIPLPSKLRKNGFWYTLIQRGQRSFIYRQEVAPGIESFEVFEERIRPSWTIKGRVIPAMERFPDDNAFGIWAFSFRTKEAAQRKFQELEVQEGGAS